MNEVSDAGLWRSARLHCPPSTSGGGLLSRRRLMVGNPDNHDGLLGDLLPEPPPLSGKTGLLGHVVTPFNLLRAWTLLQGGRAGAPAGEPSGRHLAPEGGKDILWVSAKQSAPAGPWSKR